MLRIAPPALEMAKMRASAEGNGIESTATDAKMACQREDPTNVLKKLNLKYSVLEIMKPNIETVPISAATIPYFDEVNPLYSLK